MYIKYCKAFELALRGRDETYMSGNQSINVALINFAAKLNDARAIQIKISHVFKGVLKTIRNELLDEVFQTEKQKFSLQISLPQGPLKVQTSVLINNAQLLLDSEYIYKHILELLNLQISFFRYDLIWNRIISIKKFGIHQ